MDAVDELPDRGSGYTAPDGLPSFHLRAACPSRDQWVKFVDKTGPWFIPRESVGLAKCDGYFSEVTR